MFTDAIEKASRFTRPIHTISRYYNSTEIVPGSATLFVVNKDGWALTCKHVVQLLTSPTRVNNTYDAFRKELNKIKGTEDLAGKKAALEKKYNYTTSSIVELRNNLVDCVDKTSSFKIHVHPVYDLALVRFEGFSKLFCNEFPVFQSDESYLKQGRFLCRLGYPFPEFTNYRYNSEKDIIEWTTDGRSRSPIFPIEGMITRFLRDKARIHGIEMSVPGLRGQSGGPLFNDKGIVQGMQFTTKHLHLGFDVEDKEIRVKGNKKKVRDYPFLHLGHCIHVSVLKEFMREKGVEFKEE
ncbi:MAG: serine protease [Bacteroidales bacterium]|nr:serine protease [Bacteroidales bacterium]